MGTQTNQPESNKHVHKNMHTQKQHVSLENVWNTSPNRPQCPRRGSLGMGLHVQWLTLQNLTAVVLARCSVTPTKRNPAKTKKIHNRLCTKKTIDSNLQTTHFFFTPNEKPSQHQINTAEKCACQGAKPTWRWSTSTSQLGGVSPSTP